MILVKNDPECRRRLARNLSLAFLSEDSPQSDHELWRTSKINLHNVRSAELVFWSRGTDGKFQKDSDTCLIDLTRKGLGYEDTILLRLPIRNGRYPMLRVVYMRSWEYVSHTKMIKDFYNIAFPSLTPVYENRKHARELPVKLSQFTIYAQHSENEGYLSMWEEFRLMDRLYPWD